MLFTEEDARVIRAFLAQTIACASRCRRKLRRRPKFGGSSRQRQKGFSEFLPDPSISIRSPLRDSLTFPGASTFQGARCNSNSVNSGDFSKFH